MSQVEHSIADNNPEKAADMQSAAGKEISVIELLRDMRVAIDSLSDTELPSAQQRYKSASMLKMLYAQTESKQIAPDEALRQFQEIGSQMRMHNLTVVHANKALNELFTPGEEILINGKEWGTVEKTSMNTGGGSNLKKITVRTLDGGVTCVYPSTIRHRNEADIPPANADELLIIRQYCENAERNWSPVFEAWSQSESAKEMAAGFADLIIRDFPEADKNIITRKIMELVMNDVQTKIILRTRSINQIRMTLKYASNEISLKNIDDEKVIASAISLMLKETMNDAKAHVWNLLKQGATL
jgi:hypothetical protein